MNRERPEESNDNAADGERIEWHPAFFEAIKMELEEYGDKLSFISEYQLTAQPLRDNEGERKEL